MAARPEGGPDTAGPTRRSRVGIKIAALAASVGLGVTGLMLLEQVPNASAATKAPLPAAAVAAIANAKTVAGKLTAPGAVSIVKGTGPAVGATSPGTQSSNNAAAGLGSTPAATTGGGTTASPAATIGGISFCNFTIQIGPIIINIPQLNIHIQIGPFFVHFRAPCFLSGRIPTHVPR